MAEEDVRIVPLLAREEPAENPQAFQKELQAFGTWFTWAGLRFSEQRRASDQNAQGEDRMQEFIVTASPKDFSIVAATCGGWVQARSGRKVHVEIGDLKIQASAADAILDYFETMKVFRGWMG